MLQKDRPALLHVLKFEQPLAKGQLVEIGNLASNLLDQSIGEPAIKGDEETKQAKELAQANKAFWDLVYHVEKLRKRGMGDEE